MTPQQIIIYEWIRDHAPIAVQMSVRPDNIAWLENAIGEALASARAEGMREGLEQALYAVSTLPAYSLELERAHKAIRTILSAIGEKP